MHKQRLLLQNGLHHGSQLLLPNGNSSMVSSFLCHSTIFVSFLKKKIGVVDAAPISAIKLPVADLSQAVSARYGTICTPAYKRISGCTCGNCVDNDCNLKKCGIVHKAPWEPQSLAERTPPKGITGISHAPSLWMIPGMRSCLQNLRTICTDVFHLSAASLTVMYSIKNPFFQFGGSMLPGVTF